MLPIRIFVYLIFLSFILIPLYFPKAPGIIWCSSGISIFLRPIPLCRTATLFLEQNHSFLTVCYAPTCFKIESDFPFGNTPDVSTFYDFFSCIWQEDSNSLSQKDRSPKMKPPTLPVLPRNFFLCLNVGAIETIESVFPDFSDL